MGQATRKSGARQSSTSQARASARSVAGVTRAALRPHQQDVVHRLRRVEGQIRGVLAMIENEQACGAIAQQLSAARKALDRAFYEMLACSLETEIDGARDTRQARERISETTRLLAKYA